MRYRAVGCGRFEMAISASNVIANGFVVNGAQSNAHVGSYNVTVRDIVSNGEIVNSSDYTLKPQQMVVVVSKERIRLDAEHIAFAHPKTSLCRSGILALNTGIIDPEYDGYISTVIINFRKEPYTIKKGDVFLRIVFHRFCEDATVVRERDGDGYLEYVKGVSADTLSYPETFLDVDNSVNNIINRVRRVLVGGIVKKLIIITSLFVSIVTIVCFFIAFMQYAMQDRALDFIQIEAREDMKNLNAEVARLKERLSVVEGGKRVHRK